jgi:ribosome-associated translation inhibitor RaiA
MPQPAVIDQLSDAQRQAVEDLLIAFRFKDYDGAVDKVHRQLRRKRDKIQDHKHLPGLGEMEAQTA